MPAKCCYQLLVFPANHLPPTMLGRLSPNPVGIMHTSPGGRHGRKRNQNRRHQMMLTWITNIQHNFLPVIGVTTIVGHGRLLFYLSDGAWTCFTCQQTRFEPTTSMLLGHTVAYTCNESFKKFYDPQECAVGPPTPRVAFVCPSKHASTREPHNDVRSMPHNRPDCVPRGQPVRPQRVSTARRRRCRHRRTKKGQQTCCHL